MGIYKTVCNGYIHKDALHYFELCFGRIVRSVGASGQAMTGNMIGTITNIILDPIFILLLEWGVTGAAVAAVIGNLFAVIYYLYYILRKQTILSVKPQDFSCKNNIAKNVFFIGTPTMLNTLLVSVSNIVRNNMLAQYGDLCVAAMGIAAKVDMVVSMILTGLGAGIQPLIGYSYGAGNKRRLRKTFRTTAIYAVVLGTILTLITAVLRTPLIRMFIDDGHCLSVCCTCYWALYIIHKRNTGYGESEGGICSQYLPSGNFVYSGCMPTKFSFGIRRDPICPADRGLCFHCNFTFSGLWTSRKI